MGQRLSGTAPKWDSQRLSATGPRGAIPAQPVHAVAGGAVGVDRHKPEVGRSAEYRFPVAAWRNVVPPATADNRAGNKDAPKLYCRSRPCPDARRCTAQHTPRRGAPACLFVCLRDRELCWADRWSAVTGRSTQARGATETESDGTRREYESTLTADRASQLNQEDRLGH